MRCGLAAALFVAVGIRASAHRLDEYLQGAIISVEKNRLEAQMTLTPGVTVFPLLLAQIDTDADGSISEVEGQEYGNRVLRDLTVTLDGNRLTLHLIAVRLPAIYMMREGRGEIQLDFSTQIPDGGRNRTLTFENRHQSRIAAYQVNCLVPRDPDIRITAQERNFSQSFYRLEYARNDIGFGLTSLALWCGGFGWLGLLALFGVKHYSSRRERLRGYKR